MVTTVKVSVKDFNAEKLQQELTAVPIAGISWAGFIRLDDRRYTPFPEASRVVGVSSASGNDVAVRGELRFFSDIALTQPQSSSIDTVLTAHNSATLTAEQVRIDQDTSELDALLATDRPAYLANIQTWDAKTTAQKAAASKEMFIIIGKVLRIFIRRNRVGGGDI